MSNQCQPSPPSSWDPVALQQTRRSQVGVGVRYADHSALKAANRLALEPGRKGINLTCVNLKLYCFGSEVMVF